MNTEERINALEEELEETKEELQEILLGIRVHILEDQNPMKYWERSEIADQGDSEKGVPENGG